MGLSIDAVPLGAGQYLTNALDHVCIAPRDNACVSKVSRECVRPEPTAFSHGSEVVFIPVFFNDDVENAPNGDSCVHDVYGLHMGVVYCGCVCLVLEDDYTGGTNTCGNDLEAHR